MMRHAPFAFASAYAGVTRGLLVEPYIGRGNELPIDYKLFVFGGRVAFVQVHLDRATAHRWIVMDRDWVRASPPTGDPDPARPASLDQLINGAERLARGYHFLRIDCYEVAGKPLFGEVTIYPGSGLLPVVPASLDRYMGTLWQRSREDERPDPSASLLAATRLPLRAKVGRIRLQQPEAEIALKGVGSPGKSTTQAGSI